MASSYDGEGRTIGRLAVLSLTLLVLLIALVVNFALDWPADPEGLHWAMLAISVSTAAVIWAAAASIARELREEIERLAREEE
jgi:hypothetical protein